MTQPRSTLKIQLAKNHVWIATRCMHARTWGARLVGLLGHSHLGDGEGMLLEPASSIHSIGMRFAIDVIFIRPLVRAQNPPKTRVFSVVASRGNYPPYSLLPLGHARARAVLELPVGTLDRCDLSVGDELWCIS